MTASGSTNAVLIIEKLCKVHSRQVGLSRDIEDLFPLDECPN